MDERPRRLGDGDGAGGTQREWVRSVVVKVVKGTVQDIDITCANE